ncbi:MAG TPA: nucleotide disphospho-sugar-binding domain-containing protein [Devosia sp.]|nr:nucleotide disphospho-sugar-binding domain-containing protein [Devosia sp.]
MARITFLSVPAYGHLNPALPIVAELVRRGHEVTVFDEPAFEAAVSPTGASFVPYPPVMSMEDMAAVLIRGDLMETFELFIRSTPALYDFCLRALRQQRPDVIVIDGIALWGEMVGRRLGIPTVVTSPFFAYEIGRNAGQAEFTRNLKNFLRQLGPFVLHWIRVGLRGPWLLPLHWPLMPVRGNLTLMLTSRELHPPSPIFDRGGWAFVGATIDPRTRTETFDFSRLDGRPVIYVSLGTLIFGKSDFYERCMAALGDYPGQVLLSAGKGSDLTRYANARHNFIVEQSFPQLEVLQRADIFVTPAGLNSVHEALWYGVPMVTVPQHFEQLHNAEAVARGGAGVLLDAEAHGGRVAPEDLRRAVEIVAADLPRYRDRARALGESLRRPGGYAEAANRIEAMVRR